jgi:hypothetical protein
VVVGADLGISLHVTKASENEITGLAFGGPFIQADLTSDNVFELDWMLFKDELGVQMETLMGADLPIALT